MPRRTCIALQPDRCRIGEHCHLAADRDLLGAGWLGRRDAELRAASRIREPDSPTHAMLPADDPEENPRKLQETLDPF